MIFRMQQVAAVIQLCQHCVKKWAILPQDVLAHSDIAPQRKQDPGEKFPWRSLFEAGVGHWVEPSRSTGGRFLQRGDQRPARRSACRRCCRFYGYGVEVNGLFDDTTEILEMNMHRVPAPFQADQRLMAWPMFRP